MIKGKQRLTSFLLDGSQQKMDKCLQTAVIPKVFVLQGRGCAQSTGNFKGFPKLIIFLFFELFEIEKIGLEWRCVFIELSGISGFVQWISHAIFLFKEDVVLTFKDSRFSFSSCT